MPCHYPLLSLHPGSAPWPQFRFLVFRGDCTGVSRTSLGQDCSGFRTGHLPVQVYLEYSLCIIFQYEVSFLNSKEGNCLLTPLCFI